MEELAKLHTHLNLLREEYAKLQAKCADIEAKNQILQASSGKFDTNCFVSRLLKSVASLYNKEEYSDVDIKLNNCKIHAHRFVLAARSEKWKQCFEHRNEKELNFEMFSDTISTAILRWVYCDVIDLDQGDDILLDLLRASSYFQLTPLAERCEQALLASVFVHNSVHFYQAADEIGAKALRDHCCSLVSSHWNDLSHEQFVALKAPLAYRLFTENSKYPLHTAIRMRREDVVFLYLVDTTADLPNKLNEVDDRGDIALDLCLRLKLLDIANNLVNYGVNVNTRDGSGRCLLHKAIDRGDNISLKFLLDNGCDCNLTTVNRNENALHLVAKLESSDLSLHAELASMTSSILSSGCDPIAQDNDGNTPLHLAILAGNEPVFHVLVREGSLNFELQNNNGCTVLWLALWKVQEADNLEESWAKTLLQRGSSANSINNHSGDSILHMCCRAGKERTAMFLSENGGDVNLVNKKGESILHLACKNGMGNLCQLLLDQGSNPNLQTTDTDATESTKLQQTPFHLAVLHGHKNIVDIFLAHKKKLSIGGDSMLIIPNFGIKNSTDETVFSMAVWQQLYDIAKMLLSGGSSINESNSIGQTILHQALLKKDVDSALFIIDNNADVNARTNDQKSCLDLAISLQLPKVVEALCCRGVDMEAQDSTSCALWDALSSEQHDVADILIKHGCKLDHFMSSENGVMKTCLHRAIEQENEIAACILINAGCSVDLPQKSSYESEVKYPIHMACCLGLLTVVIKMLERKADVNIENSNCDSVLHMAIEHQHLNVVSVLLDFPSIRVNKRNKQGLTPFAMAMACKSNDAARAILLKEPGAAEQLDGRGRNFLHLAVQRGDFEAVLFLISVRVNVNSLVRDASQNSPLHIAVKAGHELIARHLILAGADINALTPAKQTSLHLAAAGDHSLIAALLLENGVDFNALDSAQNNALHIATQACHLKTTRVLLTKSHIDAEKMNLKGQNPVHMLGLYGKENAAAIFDLFIETMPNYPVDKQDLAGNTVLLHAYVNGNGSLCRAIVRAGARMGVPNKESGNIFNAPVATKQLLFGLLDMLVAEPPWCDGDNCLECGVKFGIKTRKHHCRHCGRLLCSRCSEKDVPIIKYNIQKPVRVCDTCFEVLTGNVKESR